MSPTIPSATGTEIALRTAAALLIVLGSVAALSGLGVLKRRGRPRADKFSGVRAAAGFVMLVVGAICYLAGGGPPTEGEVITRARFSSQSGPSLAIDMPPNWTLTHDRAAGRLTATDGASTLLIETSLVTDGIDPQAFIKVVSDRARAANGTVGDTFHESIDGLNAVVFSLAVATQTTNVWYVPRGGPLLTVITCRAALPANPSEACRGPLHSLRWRSPGPL